MILLNYLYFVIITLWGLAYLLRNNEPQMLTHPFNKRKKVPLDGTSSFWVLTFSTGLLALSAPGGSIDLMAIRLLILEVFCIIGLIVSKRTCIWGFTATIYLLYLLWLVIGLWYTPDRAFGIRVILKYIYPFLIMLFASAATWNQYILWKASLNARKMAIISLVVFFVPGIFFLFPGVFWYGTAAAIHYIAICIFSLALFHHTKDKRKNLIWAIIFAIPCIIWVFRTSIMGTIAAIMMFYFFKYKMKSLPIVAGIFILGVAAVFTIPSLKNKMFKGGGENINMESFYAGQISTDDIQPNYRGFMWEWALKHHYKENEIIGTGTGDLQRDLYTSNVFGEQGIVHNDYIQILCDNGLIGLILYLLASLGIVFHSFIIYNKRGAPMALKICAITSGATMFGMLFTLYSDNVVNYSMATLSYPWGFYGMALGLNRAFQKAPAKYTTLNNRR